MREHILKVWPEFFNAIMKGEKKAEIHLNDRDYKVGDYLYLQEWCPDMMQSTGRNFRVQITHILEGGRGMGLANGYVCLSITDGF
jgi:hypothetical protein